MQAIYVGRPKQRNLNINIKHYYYNLTSLIVASILHLSQSPVDAAKVQQIIKFRCSLFIVFFFMINQISLNSFTFPSFVSTMTLSPSISLISTSMYASLSSGIQARFFPAHKKFVNIHASRKFFVRSFVCYESSYSVPNLSQYALFNINKLRT